MLTTEYLSATRVSSSIRPSGSKSPAGFTTQAEFLMNMGIGDALTYPSLADLEGHYTRRRAVSGLVDPAGLGRIKVLAQAKGVGAVTLSGFAGNA